MFNTVVINTLMANAYTKALFSPDPSSQNGAILVRRDSSGTCEQVVQGYNHFYKGIKPEVYNRDEKLRRIEHAERDSIYKAARLGIKTRGLVMICPWAACSDCARAIIGAGIDALVCHKERYEITDPRWKPQVDQALTWMQNSGIWIYMLEGSIKSQPILVSGRKWSPESCSYVD